MRGTAGVSSFHRLSMGARSFGLLVLTPPAVASQDSTAALALIALGAIWLLASVRVRNRLLPARWTLVAEAALVGAICALAMDATLALLGALAVPPFTAALRRGPRGMLVVLSVELVTVVTARVVLDGPLGTEAGTTLFTWVVIGVGLGLIGSFLQTSLRDPSDPLTPYRDAQALIRELIDLSGDLGSGLDPVSLGTTVAETVRDELPVSALLVAVPHEGGLRPLVTQLGSSPDALDELTDLAGSAMRTVEPVRAGGTIAFPLMTDAGLVAVVACRLPAGLGPGSATLVDRVASLTALLEPTAVHLDTAMLFTRFRDAAASDERRRVAREMHDGLAQDIASRGYLLDAVAARPADAEQAAQLRVLRDRLSAVVAEVRRSVQTLRTDVGSSESLGAAIGRLARHLIEASGVPIHVTVEEGTTRLSGEVEAELLRIAQEAMTNAVRHARASRIEVRCRVQAPDAEIVVSDDGRGLGPRRHDSQGLEIMNERARLAGATLSITDAVPRGTVVRVATPGLSPAEPIPPRVRA